MRDRSNLRAGIAALLLPGALLALTLAGCGSSNADTSRAAPPASDFPAVAGRSLPQIYASVKSDQDHVVAPTDSIFHRGINRFGFGIFTLSQDQVADADVAIYAAPRSGGPVRGPFPARYESLTTKPQFEAQSTASDPAAAKGVYVSNVKLDKAGPWDVVAMVRSGGQLQASRVPTIQVGGGTGIPAVGQAVPRIHTPTTASVGGDIGQIDTRVPHDDMHGVDLADVLGKEPVVLLFATPALCQSRVCGPVVDVTEQVEHEFPNDRIAFIHNEIYADNKPPKLRPQVKAFGLRTEPWLFVIDENGRVSSRIEGAFSVPELEAAIRNVLPASSSS